VLALVTAWRKQIRNNGMRSAVAITPLPAIVFYTASNNTDASSRLAGIRSIFWFTATAN